MYTCRGCTECIRIQWNPYQKPSEPNAIRRQSDPQIITMPLQILQNATQQSDHHTQQCQLQKLSQSHQAIAHQHMPTKCQKQQLDVDRDLAAQSDQIQDATKGCVPQIRQQWHGQTITEQIRLSQLQKHQTLHQNPSQVQKIQWESHQSLSENRGSQSESNEDPTKAYQKTEVLNQNPMKIPPKPVRKQRFSIRIQWRSHQSPSEKRGFVKTLQNPLGKSWDFRFTIAKQTPP